MVAYVDDIPTDIDPFQAICRSRFYLPDLRATVFEASLDRQNDMWVPPEYISDRALDRPKVVCIVGDADSVGGARLAW